MTRGDLWLFGLLCAASGVGFALGPYHEGWTGIPNWILAPALWLGTFIYWLSLRKRVAA